LLLGYAFLGNWQARMTNLLAVASNMNRNGHPMGLGWLSLLLCGLSFAAPHVKVISVGHGATRLGEPDVLHGAAALATALIVLAYGAFFTRNFYCAEFLAMPALVLAFVTGFPWIRVYHVGMLLWVTSILCLIIAAYRCDAYRERALHPHP
jgi:hypothetical protein